MRGTRPTLLCARRAVQRCWLVFALGAVGCVLVGDPGPESLVGDALWDALPRRAGLESRSDGIYWHSDTRAFEIVRGENERGVWLATPAGELWTSWVLLEASDPDPLAGLDVLLAHAREEDLSLRELGFHFDPLAGGYLVGSGMLVLREGVFHQIAPDARRELARARHGAARARLRAAIDALKAHLPESSLDRAGQIALADILDQLDAEHDERQAFNFIPPDFARRLVRHGWLDGLDLPKKLRDDLREATLFAEARISTARFENERGYMAYASDAFDQGVWTLQTDVRSGYARRAPTPAYFSEQVAPVQLVVRTPPDVDPITGFDRPLSLELYYRAERIASWSESEKFQSDRERWRKAFPGVDGRGEGALAGALPPHLVLVRPNGDVESVFTAHGVLSPARDGSEEESARFFDAAARVLPDAAHLDLIGEYLLVYAFDSPDSRWPDLVGTREVAGDIHQTARQTLGTQTGGMYRGDCDDLSELYQAIAVRQGRTAHLIGLPAHAALAWAEPVDAGWRTIVLQTGQPLAFDATTLPESLELAYKSFGSGDVLDANKLEVLLRFSGENTRSSWYLSHRIFSDAAYARTMIDIQRDWHFQTFQRAIRKVRAMIDAGDGDEANYAELAGLYHFTGQYAEAAEVLGRVAERPGSLQNRVSTALERVSALYASEQLDAANTLVRSMLDTTLPALEAELGGPVTDPYLSLAQLTSANTSGHALALEILTDSLGDRIDATQNMLVGRLEKEYFDKRLWHDGVDEPARIQVRWYAALGIGLLVDAEGKTTLDPERRRAVVARVRRWIDQLAFEDMDPSASVLSRYAVVAHFYRAVLGAEESGARVGAAPRLVDLDRVHTVRPPGEATTSLDFQWIAASPAFWASELGELFDEDRATLDVERAAVLAARFNDARHRARALGLDSPSLDSTQRTVDGLAALAARDTDALVRLFSDVSDRRDRRIRQATALMVARTARLMPLAWYEEVLSLWRDYVNDKASWFGLAWNAALAKAPRHAVVAARFGAEEFPEDAAFAEEYAYMRARFAGEIASRRSTVPGAHGTLRQ